MNLYEPCGPAKPSGPGLIDSELVINPCEEKIDDCALDEHNEEAFLKLS